MEAIYHTVQCSDSSKGNLFSFFLSVINYSDRKFNWKSLLKTSLVNAFAPYQTASHVLLGWNWKRKETILCIRRKWCASTVISQLNLTFSDWFIFNYSNLGKFHLSPQSSWIPSDSPFSVSAKEFPSRIANEASFYEMKLLELLRPELRGESSSSSTSSSTGRDAISAEVIAPDVSSLRETLNKTLRRGKGDYVKWDKKTKMAMTMTSRKRLLWLSHPSTSLCPGKALFDRQNKH